MKQSIPTALADLLHKQQERVQACTEQLAITETVQSELDLVLIGSDYVADQLQRHPELLVALMPDLHRCYEADELSQAVHAQVAQADSEESLARVLRQIRRREMVRIIWRDLNRLADLRETTRTLTDLADSTTDAALNWLYEHLAKDFGYPTSDQGERQPLVVLGMGKLGAHELNLSSDIDLIFTFPENGETEGGRRSLSNQEFFTRLGKRLIKALDAPTADGFVFRVDMRLRPFGNSGPLVASFDAMENYYQSQGRDWERYALIKARPMAGDLKAGEQLMLALRPFMYRKYIDYSAFESLRDMKRMITRENRIKGRENNIKLGAGGIREIEFIAQAFQLIRGGRDARLQQRELLNILPLLPESVGLPEQVSAELTEAYLFLRDLEHAIQAVADRQTQELPVDELERERVAWSVMRTSWDEMMERLNAYRATVSRHFADVIAPAESEEGAFCEVKDSELKSLWEGQFEEDEPLLEYLQRLGFEQPESIASHLKALRELRTVQVLQSIGQDRLLQLLPLLLRELVTDPNPEQTLERTLRLIQAVLRRSAYLVLLAENPGALKQMVRLCSASSWFADQLAKQPVLLDELIDAHTLFHPPKSTELRDELNQHLLRVPEDDTEQFMETLRYFKNAHILRVAAADITGVLPLMKVSDYLTWLAEAILDAVLDIAWKDLTSKYGVPSAANGEPSDREFVIIGYGKLGGIELSYGSDLDLVFVHDLPSDTMTVGGPREIANAVFFTRLGQRIIHMLNTFTTSGQLYEVDMRLRPSGNSGLLVSSLEAFKQYQVKEAWTWEHQALVRARVVAGSAALAQRFEAVRAEILTQQRDPETLREEVVSMREKMREHLSSGENSEGMNLKQDAGGIVDIEFTNQYLVLRHAHANPDLYRYTDNIRILDALEEAQILSAEDANTLREAYKAYRALGHRQSLQNHSGLISDASLTEMRANVKAIWNRIFGL